jgi:hypothetical protein
MSRRSSFDHFTGHTITRASGELMADPWWRCADSMTTP